MPMGGSNPPRSLPRLPLKQWLNSKPRSSPRPRCCKHHFRGRAKPPSLKLPSLNAPSPPNRLRNPAEPKRPNRLRLGPSSSPVPQVHPGLGPSRNPHGPSRRPGHARRQPGNTPPPLTPRALLGRLKGDPPGRKLPAKNAGVAKPHPVVLPCQSELIREIRVKQSLSAFPFLLCPAGLP
jgi:hypothetical protein